MFKDSERKISRAALGSTEEKCIKSQMMDV